MKAIKSVFERKDFIWKDDQALWHERRAEEMRKKYGPQIKALEGHDPSSIFIFMVASLSHWIVAVSIASYLGERYGLIALVGWWVGGYWAVAAGLAMHECAHQLVFRGRWPAFAAGIIGQMPLFVPAYKSF
jgi:sphingolipid 4-desaturase/C4-monooxygenase